MKFIQQNGHNTDQTTTGKFISYILVIMYMCIPHRRLELELREGERERKRKREMGGRSVQRQ